VSIRLKQNDGSMVEIMKSPLSSQAHGGSLLTGHHQKISHILMLLVPRKMK
jgi:hypothetical protein